VHECEKDSKGEYIYVMGDWAKKGRSYLGAVVAVLAHVRGLLNVCGCDSQSAT
jgi:hypothetical protein